MNFVITINLEITLQGVMTLQWKPHLKNLVIMIGLEIMTGSVLTKAHYNYEISLYMCYEVRIIGITYME